MSYTCPQCARTSQSPDDERERYCANCHLFAEAIRVAVAGAPPLTEEQMDDIWRILVRNAEAQS